MTCHTSYVSLLFSAAPCWCLAATSAVSLSLDGHALTATLCEKEPVNKPNLVRGHWTAGAGPHAPMSLATPLSAGVSVPFSFGYPADFEPSLTLQAIGPAPEVLTDTTHYVIPYQLPEEQPPTPVPARQAKYNHPVREFDHCSSNRR